MISVVYDPTLVALSVLIAAVASYTALDLAARAKVSGRGAWSFAWVVAAAFAMGGGIWSMHFVAMLALQMPGVPVSYDPILTSASFAIAVIATGAGFALVQKVSGPLALVVSSLFMGTGIAAMHYMGMAAMQMPAAISYKAGWVAVSLAIAIGSSLAALWLAFNHHSLKLRGLAALPMGFAIAGMHYSAMQGAIFSSHTGMDHGSSSPSLGQANLAIVISVITFAVLLLATVAAGVDRRLAVMAEREATALRRSGEQLKELYRQTPIPLHALDADGVVQEVSDAWLDLLGRKRVEVVGRPLSSFMNMASAEQFESCDWPLLLATGGPSAIEYSFVTNTGATLSVLSTLRVLPTQQGAERRVIGGLIDLTDRKKAEQALVQAQKMEALGQLTGGVAHDFNNLLAVVIGSLDMLKKRMPDDERTERLISNAMEAARRGATLTQRMLAFARKQDLKVASVDVGQLIVGMTDLIKSSVGSLIMVEMPDANGLPPVLADANQLELALLNLVVNARDAMPDGGTLRLLVERVPPGGEVELAPGTYASIKVIDTGQGMDEQTLARVRDPFFTTKGPGKGTGLGLSMVHGFAAQSGGALVLTSKPGVGTTAEILLPVATQTGSYLTEVRSSSSVAGGATPAAS